MTFGELINAIEKLYAVFENEDGLKHAMPALISAKYPDLGKRYDDLYDRLDKKSDDYEFALAEHTAIAAEYALRIQPIIGRLDDIFERANQEGDLT